jgi:hypothetical protein
MPMQRTKVEFICPNGRKNTRTVTGTGPVRIRCSCGCGYIYEVRFR